MGAWRFLPCLHLALVGCLPKQVEEEPDVPLPPSVSLLGGSVVPLCSPMRGEIPWVHLHGLGWDFSPSAFAKP